MILFLLVEHKGDEIDWNSFIMKARMYGFEKFSEIMFLLCNKLFNMEVPKEINIKVVNNKKYVSALLNEIF